MPDFHEVVVKAITPLTPNAVDVEFEIPQNLINEYQFKAGQYLTLESEIAGKKVRRAYSISSAPSSGKHTTGIKKMPNGTFSVYANQTLKAGDTLLLGTPEGRFVFESSEDAKNIIAFAAGSGITPIISIAQTVLESNSENTFVLVYGNSTPAEAMYKSQLSNLIEKHKDRFFVYWVYSQANEDGALFGRIEKSTINLVLKNKHKDLSFDGYYLCGPEGMIQTVEKALLANNIEESKIYTELFTSGDSEGAKVDAVKQAKLKVVLDEEDFELELKDGEFLLDAVLKADIDAPYSCQGGVCSSCIARVTEGEVEMVKNQILTDSEVEEGLILTCQAKAKSSVIKIDYDDV